MRKRNGLFAAGALLAATVTGLGLAPGAVASPGSPVVGHTYVNDNTAGANTVAAFDRHADGSLTPMPDRRSPSGERVWARALAHRERSRPARTAAICSPSMPAATDLGAAARTQAASRSRSGRPVSSGGVQPVSVTISTADSVYVANVGNGGSNYTGFLLTHYGELPPVPRLDRAGARGIGRR